MWIHEHTEWPEFTWDMACLGNALAEARFRQGRLLGRVEKLGFNLQREAVLKTMTSDVINTSAIEGERLDSDEVRSSVARRLGIDAGGLVRAGRDVEGIVEIMLDATRNFSAPLTKKRLFAWHAALFPTGRSGMFRITVGAWRTAAKGPMQVVSGAVGKEKVHYEAPPARRVNAEMTAFLAWLRRGGDVDPMLKAGVAHLWFESIHPFEDGNGRIGRAIADMALARADGVADRFYSMSTQIKAEQKEYYRQLESQQRRPPDLTGWLEWFLACYLRALQRAEQVLARVLFKAQLWEKINRQPVNPRQRIVINRMLEDDFHGHMNTSKYARMSKCSADTALRDMQQLQKRRILTRNPSGGRSTSYRLTDDAGAVDND